MRSTLGAFAAQVSGEIFEGRVEGGVGVFAGEEREKIGTKGVKFVGHGIRPLTLRALDAGMRLVVSRAVQERRKPSLRDSGCLRRAGYLTPAPAGPGLLCLQPMDLGNLWRGSVLS